VRRLALVAACALLAAGCGGSKKPSDPGRAAIDELVAAVKARDTNAIWERVTPATQRRLGKTRTISLVEGLLRPFVGRSYRTIVSQLVTERYGFVAISTPRAIVAVPFAKEGHGLRAELGVPLHIEPSGPLPKVYTHRVAPQVAFEVTHASEEPTVLLYLDGFTLLPKVYAAGSSATVYSTLPDAFKRGRHTVVAFAATPTGAAARAWAFTIR